jgi:YgiT-type zinc finger domain-containing protein
LDRLQGEEAEMTARQEDRLVHRRVTYTLEMDGKFYIIENVPARVDEETGEQFFSPSTIERLQSMILSNAEPNKVLQTPVYEYAD